VRAAASIAARLRAALRPWYGWSLNERRLLAGLLLFSALAMAARWVSWHTAAPPQPFVPPSGATIP
jgi:hypothetical protein